MNTLDVEFPDKLLSLSEIPSLPWLPARRRGTRLSVACLYRWAHAGLKGADGQIHRLKTVRAGGNIATTETWLREFFVALARTSAEPTLSPSQQHAQADARLAAVGL